MLIWRNLWLITVLACTACGPQTSQVKPKQVNGTNPSKINALLCAEYIKRKNLEVALSKCNKSLKQNPSNAQAHKWSAVLHQRLGADKLAGRHFQRAIDLEPQDSSVRNNYGTYLCRQKQYRQAEQQFLKAISDPLYQGRHIAYVNAGICMQNIDDKRKAELYFRSALRTHPLFGPALIRMARLSYDSNRCLSALGFIRRWSKKNHWSSSSLWLAMKVEKKCGNSNKSASHKLLLRARFPTSSEASKVKQRKRRY